MFFTQILKDNDAYYALHNTYFHSVFYSKKHFNHLVQIGKDIFHLQFTKQKRLLDTYQEIDRKNSTFLFLCKIILCLPPSCISIHSLIITVFSKCSI